jgi:hypothetical protein
MLTCPLVLALPLVDGIDNTVGIVAAQGSLSPCLEPFSLPDLLAGVGGNWIGINHLFNLNSWRYRGIRRDLEKELLSCGKIPRVPCATIHNLTKGNPAILLTGYGSHLSGRVKTDKEIC